VINRRRLPEHRQTGGAEEGGPVNMVNTTHVPSSTRANLTEQQHETPPPKRIVCRVYTRARTRAREKDPQGHDAS